MKYYIETTREMMIETMLHEMEEKGEKLPESTKMKKEKEE